jgi:hypothetical protein
MLVGAGVEREEDVVLLGEELVSDLLSDLSPMFGSTYNMYC